MDTEINLLAQKKAQFFSEERVLLITKGLAVGSVVLVLSLSILFFLLSRDPSIVAVQADENQTIAKLTLLQDKTAKYLLIVDRVNKMKAILQKKSTFGTTMTALTKQIPTGSTITNFTLDQQTLSLSLSSSDLSTLGKAMDNFSSLVTSRSVLKSVTIQGLVSDEKSGTYVLSITGVLL